VVFVGDVECAVGGDGDALAVDDVGEGGMGGEHEVRGHARGKIEENVGEVDAAAAVFEECVVVVAKAVDAGKSLGGARGHSEFADECQREGGGGEEETGEKCGEREKGKMTHGGIVWRGNESRNEGGLWSDVLG
jgi:hypothetical protein